MFDFLTGAVLLLSAVYEGYRLYHAVNALAALNSAAASLDTDTAAFIQTEAMKNDTIVEIVCCSALLLLTLICLIRFIRWAIIGNIIFLTHNTTKGFLKTTNNKDSGPTESVKIGKKPRSTGGMRITNDKPKEKPDK